MYTTINFCNFADAFRSVRPDNFSYEGLAALFEHLEQLEEETGEGIELDVIALCCEYEELSIDEVREVYGSRIPDDWGIIEYLKDRTEVIEIPKTDRVIIRSF